MASVVCLFRAPGRRLSMEEVETADAVADLGFVGCAHAKKKSLRQVLLVDKKRWTRWIFDRALSAKTSPPKAST
jgi:hypothetical protein